MKLVRYCTPKHRPRRLGTPEISVDIYGRKYTKDIDAVKFKTQFKGNVVELGSFLPHLSHILSCLIKTTTFRIQGN